MRSKRKSAPTDASSHSSTTILNSIPPKEFIRDSQANFNSFLAECFCSPIEPFGKDSVMNVANNGILPRYSKLSGVSEWKNCVFLWVNIQEPEPKYPNIFSGQGKYIKWFGNSKMALDSPVIQRLLSSQHHTLSYPFLNHQPIILGHNSFESNDLEFMTSEVAESKSEVPLHENSVKIPKVKFEPQFLEDIESKLELPPIPSSILSIKSEPNESLSDDRIPPRIKEQEQPSSISLRSKDEKDCVLLFARLPKQPYLCLGPLACRAASLFSPSPVSSLVMLEMELLMFETLKDLPVFQSLLTA